MLHWHPAHNIFICQSPKYLTSGSISSSCMALTARSCTSSRYFEMTLWGFLTQGIKQGMSDSQALDRITKWDGTTLGQLVRGLKTQGHWPEGMIESLEQAVETRNYLAHHFLREYFVVAPSESAKEQATEQLARVSARLEDLEEALEAHLRSLGVPGVEELDEEARAEIDKLRPKEWFDESAE